MINAKITRFLNRLFLGLFFYSEAAWSFDYKVLTKPSHDNIEWDLHQKNNFPYLRDWASFAVRSGDMTSNGTVEDFLKELFYKYNVDYLAGVNFSAKTLAALSRRFYSALNFLERQEFKKLTSYAIHDIFKFLAYHPETMYDPESIGSDNKTIPVDSNIRKFSELAEIKEGRYELAQVYSYLYVILDLFFKLEKKQGRSKLEEKNLKAFKDNYYVGTSCLFIELVDSDSKPIKAYELARKQLHENLPHWFRINDDMYRISLDYFADVIRYEVNIFLIAESGGYEKTAADTSEDSNRESKKDR